MRVFPHHLLRLLLLALSLLGGYAASAAPTETVRQDISSAAGVAWQFRPEGVDWLKIVVPAGGWRAQGLTCDAGTYRATILIPKSAAGQIVRVAFEAVNFGADVFAGSDDAHLVKVASHVNGWMPFTADITQIAKPGATLRLQVEVKGPQQI